MKRLIKSQQKNPLCNKKVAIVNKTDAKADIKPNAKALKKLKKKQLTESETKENDDLDKFAGATAEKGSKYKSRPQWKLREDNVSHTKTVKAQKKMLRKQKQLKEIRKEKKQIDRTKMRKPNPRDVDTSLVNKYLKLLRSREESLPKSKKSKWYND